MNDNSERRVRERAKGLWEQAGRPQSGIEAYIDQARELVAIEANQEFTRRPLKPGEDTGTEGEPKLSAEQAGPSGEPVEPVEVVENARRVSDLDRRRRGTGCSAAATPHRSGRSSQ
jgi:hypothetical protein